MRNLPDDTLLSSINLPGTQDTGTAASLAVTAEADAVEKTYGDETWLTFTMDEKQLVNGDTINIVSKHRI